MPIFKKIRFSLFALLPDLEQYNLGERPRKTVVVEKGNKAKGEVRHGKEWKHWVDDQGVSHSQMVKKNAPKTPDAVVLDAYDCAQLEYVLGRKWRADEGLAKVIKWHWLREESAAQIEKAHTTDDGKKEKGYSERNVANYVKAYFAADAARAEDGQERQRQAPQATVKNEFDW